VYNSESEMPEVIRLYGFRLFFWSREEKRIHIHIKHGEYEIKIWMDNFTVAKSNMPLRLEYKAIQLARLYEEEIKTKWKEYFQV
jgi:hypothetical protein